MRGTGHREAVIINHWIGKTRKVGTRFWVESCCMLHVKSENSSIRGGKSPIRAQAELNLL